MTHWPSLFPFQLSVCVSLRFVHVDIFKIYYKIEYLNEETEGEHRQRQKQYMTQKNECRMRNDLIENTLTE